MSGYSHLTVEERDRIAGLKAGGLSLRAIARALGRAASTISRELRRNSLDSGRYRPQVADGSYRLRRQRRAGLETDTKLATYVTDRLAEGWTPEQIAGRLRLGIETGLRAVCSETIYGWIYRAGQRAERLWRFLTRRHARRRQRHGRASRDTIAEKTHISQRSDDADARETVGHWEADLVICKRSRPILVLHERKTRITLMSRLAGKTAGETIAAMMAAFRRLDPRMRGSVTFYDDTCFARHMLLRGMLSATTYFCDAYASWQKGGVENANWRIRRDGCRAGPTSTRSPSRTSRTSP
jgi:IS30 family transposase